MKKGFLSDNLKYLRSANQLSVSGMAGKLGIENRGTYYAWERGLSQPSIEMLLLISRTFNLFMDELLSKKLETGQRRKIDSKSESLYEVELVPHQAVAGYSAAYADHEWLEDHLQTLTIPIEPPTGTIRAFPVSGNSMEPKAFDNSYVIGLQIEENERITDGKDYIIVTRDQGILYKNLHLKENTAVLISLNHKEHLPFEIELDDILQLWKCITVLNKLE